MRRQSFLITGFSSFVGYHFLEFLNNTQNCIIYGVDIVQPGFSFEKFKNLEIRFYQLDLNKPESIYTIIDDFELDYILHLASCSSVRDSWINPVTSFTNNTNIFLNLVEAVRILKKHPRILSVGSSVEYGNHDVCMMPLKETYEPRPLSPYSVARVSQEMISKLYCQFYGLDIVLTRSFNHIDPGQNDKFVIPSIIQQILAIKNNCQSKKTILVGNIDIVRDFVDVRDVVKAYFILLLNGEKGEIYNVCTGKGHTLQEVINITSQMADIHIDVQVDGWLIRPNDIKHVVGGNEKIISQI